MNSEQLTHLVASLPAFLLAIVLHELAHGYTAYRLGDDTAKQAGRLTFSPLAHLDPLGTIMFIVSALSGVGFGWAKPVPVAVERLRNPSRDDIIVTLSGPAANLGQAVVWGLILRLVMQLGGGFTNAFILIALSGVTINVMLMLFNLLPIPPLDGSRVWFRLFGFNDPHLADRMAMLGFVLLLIFVRSSAFDWFIRSIYNPMVRLFLP